MSDIIIIGAGISGLTAASELIGGDNNVTILEARNRIGGRINTIRSENFSRHIEEGAEFVHGDLPLTMYLLKKAGEDYQAMKGSMWRHSSGKLFKDSYIEEDNPIERKLRELKSDMSVKEFLETSLDPEKHSQLIHSVKKFVEGFDSGDYERVSAFAFRDEWLSDDHQEQFRMTNGYAKICDYLSRNFVSAGGKLICDVVVKEISWKKNSVTLTCEDGRKYDGNKIIVTVPTGVLKEKNERGSIIFNPGIPELDNWTQKSGYGSVIKIFMEFKTTFWDDDFFRNENFAQAKDMMFVFSDQNIPTWWSQLPDKYPLLTGWIAGPDSVKIENESDENILDRALQSLSNIFSISTTELLDQLNSMHVKNWNIDPFTKGGYAFKTPETSEAIRLMKNPFEETIYFAGEAFYEGKEMGTVEAAISSGMEIARMISNPGSK